MQYFSLELVSNILLVLDNSDERLRIKKSQSEIYLDQNLQYYHYLRNYEIDCFS